MSAAPLSCVENNVRNDTEISLSLPSAPSPPSSPHGDCVPARSGMQRERFVSIENGVVRPETVYLVPVLNMDERRQGNVKRIVRIVHSGLDDMFEERDTLIRLRNIIQTATIRGANINRNASSSCTETQITAAALDDNRCVKKAIDWRERKSARLQEAEESRSENQNYQNENLS